MTSLEMFEYLIGVLGSLLVIPIVQQPRFSGGMRAAITIAYCIVAGFGSVWFTGGFAGGNDTQQVVDAIMRVFIGAIAAYYGLAKPTGIAPAIERATSPRRVR